MAGKPAPCHIGSASANLTVPSLSTPQNFMLSLAVAPQAAIADGTHVPLRENNLLGSRHIRYGGYGGIAYHHIADSYIALFTIFIACGVWEAVHILDGLLKNRSQIQPDTLHYFLHVPSIDPRKIPGLRTRVNELYGLCLP